MRQDPRFRLDNSRKTYRQPSAGPGALVALLVVLFALPSVAGAALETLTGAGSVDLHIEYTPSCTDEASCGTVGVMEWLTRDATGLLAYTISVEYDNVSGAAIGELVFPAWTGSGPQFNFWELDSPIDGGVAFASIPSSLVFSFEADASGTVVGLLPTSALGGELDFCLFEVCNQVHEADKGVYNPLGSFGGTLDVSAGEFTLIPAVIQLANAAAPPGASIVMDATNPFAFTPSVAVVPEPKTGLMLSLGLFALLAPRRHT